MALNNVVIMGRLTKDIELKKANDKSVANFCVAVDKPYNKDHEHPEANWIDVVAWGANADFISKYFSKGNRIIITGSLQTRTYENKDGKTVKVTEVFVDKADFVDKKEDRPANNSVKETVKEEATDEDDPF